MMIPMLYSKIHRATVTEANLDYEGSITIDRTLMDAAGLRVHQQIHIYNITTGTRFETYVLEGEADSGAIEINGAAAHKASKGDLVILCTYAQFHGAEADKWEPKVVFVNENNAIKELRLEKASTAADTAA